MKGKTMTKSNTIRGIRYLEVRLAEKESTLGDAGHTALAKLFV